MKKNLIKAFLSLWVLTLVAVSGITLAQDPYVINIGNMDSYWVLNLGRLVMRNTGWTVWIVLDWGFGSSDYVIKIWQNAWRDDLSKLRVSNICDRNWNNCKRIADLNTWIKINGTTNGRICVKVSDQEINCNGTVVNKNETLARDSSKVVATVNGTDIKVALPANPHKEGTITTNWASDPSIQYKEGWDVKGSVQIKWAGDTRVSASNGTITVTSTDKDTKWKTVVSSTENWTTSTNTLNPYLNYVDDRNGNGSYAVVNGIRIIWDGYTTVHSANGGKEIVIASTPWTWLEVHTQGINVLGNANTTRNDTSQTTNNANTYLNHVEGSSVMNSLKIQWTDWIEVGSAYSYPYRTLTIKGTAATASNLGLIKIGYSANGKNYPVQLDSNNKAYVNVPRTDNNTYTAGDWLSLASNVFKANLKSYATSTNAAIDWWTDANRQYAVSLDKNGKLSVNVPRTEWWSIWEIGNIINKGATLYNAIKPTSTNMSKDLYLPNGNIYHDGHFEIKTLWSTATYRMNDIYVHDYGVSIWEMANKTAWLWVHWPITVGKYAQDSWRPWSCPSAVERNTISIYASWANDDEHFEILWSNRILVWVKNGWYLYFKGNNHLLVNTSTDNNSSTLNVNWPIKIGNDCSHVGCSAVNKWEVRYFESWSDGYFAWCTKVGGSYKRRRLTIGDNLSIENNNCNTSLWIPYDDSYYETHLAQPQPACS